jgi:hypothetical protein
MPHLTCPQCRASFPTGLLYIKRESCPRCRTSFYPAKRKRRDHVRSIVFWRRRIASPIDWEMITSSQYTSKT